MTAQFRNLIFEGGGVKGIAYVGAMQILEQRRILKDVRRVGGTGAGAINALLFSLGYSIPEQRDILRATDFDLSDEKKAALIREGISCTEKYFQWFEDPNEKPHNRIG